MPPEKSQNLARNGHPASSSVSEYFPELRNCVESRGGRPGLPVLDSPYGLCGRKAATLNLNLSVRSSGAA